MATAPIKVTLLAIAMSLLPDRPLNASELGARTARAGSVVVLLR